MATLSDLTNLLPRSLRGRYTDSAFWVPKINSILVELNQMADLESLKSENQLILEDGKMEYVLPSFMIKFLDIWEQNNLYNSDKSQYLNYTRRENRIRFNDQFIIDEDIRVRTDVTYLNVSRDVVKIVNPSGAWASGTLYLPGDVILDSGKYYECNTNHISSGTSYLDEVSYWSEIDNDTYVGWCIELLDGSNIGYSRIIEKFDVTTGYATLRFAFYYDNSTQNSFRLSENYLTIEYIRGFQFRDEETSGCPLLISAEVINVLEAGMKYYGYLQSDTASNEAIVWKNEYLERKQAWLKQTGRGNFNPRRKLSTEYDDDSFISHGVR